MPEIPYLQLFYLIQAGTHLYTFLHQLVCKCHDPKFYEFALHHGLALFLIIYSYLSNFWLIGAVVLFLHDPCDVCLILSRGYTDYKYRRVWVNVLIYAITYIAWIGLRNVAFPLCPIKSTYNYLMDYQYTNQYSREA